MVVPRRMNWFQKCMVTLGSAFSPNMWRKIFTGRVKIRVYLTSGEHVDIIAHSWEINQTDGKITAWEASGMNKSCFFNVNDIVAWKVK